MLVQMEHPFMLLKLALTNSGNLTATRTLVKKKQLLHPELNNTRWQLRCQLLLVNFAHVHVCQSLIIFIQNVINYYYHGNSLISENYNLNNNQRLTTP